MLGTTVKQDDLFGMSKTKEKKSRTQKRKEKKNWRESSMGTSEKEKVLGMSRKEIMELQESDQSLRYCWEKSKENTKSTTARAYFYTKNGLLHRYWQPKCTHEGQCDDACFSKLNAQEQLVLPQACRQAVLHMAHNIPLAGHLGREKTADRILQRFFWPGIHADVEMHCAQCRECQLTARPVNQRVPLVSMPVVSEPFALLAMDIVGPLERTVSGNKYILVLVDYATRYPEAIPLRSIDAETIADELIRVFA